jgi:hypothetical protein
MSRLRIRGVIISLFCFLMVSTLLLLLAIWRRDDGYSRLRALSFSEGYAAAPSGPGTTAPAREFSFAVPKDRVLTALAKMGPKAGWDEQGRFVFLLPSGRRALFDDARFQPGTSCRVFILYEHHSWFAVWQEKLAKLLRL